MCIWIMNAVTFSGWQQACRSCKEIQEKQISTHSSLLPQFSWWISIEGMPWQVILLPAYSSTASKWIPDTALKDGSLYTLTWRCRFLKNWTRSLVPPRSHAPYQNQTSPSSHVTNAQMHWVFNHFPNKKQFQDPILFQDPHIISAMLSKIKHAFLVFILSH